MPQFTNQATLSYNNTVVNSNITTGELLEVLSASKTAVVDSYGAGERVTYVISILNSGTTAFSGLTVTDNLGAFEFGENTLYPLDYVEGSLRYYVNGDLTAAPTPTDTQPLVIGGITVPAGGNAIIVYQAVANSFSPLDDEATIVNQAVISGGGLSAPITVSETIYAESAPRLTVSKSLCPATVTENSRLTYTFIIQNSGNTPATADDNVAITDVFDPALSALSVTLDGAVLSEPGGYTYDPETGSFATVPGVITVPAATYTRDPETGALITTPGYSILTVTGTV